MRDGRLPARLPPQPCGGWGGGREEGEGSTEGVLLAFTGETGAGPAPPPTVRPWPGPSPAARQACLWAVASCPQAAIGWAPPGGWASGQAFLPTPSLRFLGNQSAPAAFRSDTHTCTHTPPPLEPVPHGAVFGPTRPHSPGLRPHGVVGNAHPAEGRWAGQAAD